MGREDEGTSEFTTGDTLDDFGHFPTRAYKLTGGSKELVLKGEDRMRWAKVLIGGEEVFLSMIADGHGGKDAAVHCHACLFDYLLEAAAGEPGARALRQAARTAFIRLHQEILERDPPTTAGTTLTFCALNPSRGEITCAHVGDSIALLVAADANRRIIELCEDHRIDTSQRERDRLLKQGGLIAHAMNRHGRPGGPLRLWPGGVAQARSIGDSDIGAFNDPRPYTCSYGFPANGSADVILCSDGVWDALLKSSVVAICHKSSHCSASTTARLIVEAALRQRHAYNNQDMLVPKDDTSCVVLRIGEQGGDFPQDDSVQGCGMFMCCGPASRARESEASDKFSDAAFEH
mmetsp:Transcript_14547/g.31527  ORF Transcript_14547/g.31527 Transcript_14547/m.31527 type:complete len:348 (-) Transcript_14547:120-1163(-)